jgi:trafficking protein particle complex subunit 8
MVRKLDYGCGTIFDAEYFFSETLWVDFVLRNPFNADVELSNFTVTVREADDDYVDSTREFLDVEVIEQIVLRARETRTVSRSEVTSEFMYHLC